MHGVKQEQNYNDGTQNNHPIGNLSATYRCFPLEPFHDLHPRVRARLSWRTVANTSTYETVTCSLHESRDPPSPSHSGMPDASWPREKARPLRNVRRNPVRMTSHTSRLGQGGVMSKFERLLVAGSTELPDCRCAAEMHLTAIVPVLGGDTEIRIFRCPDCSHELRLTAWRNDVSAT